jgi:hypothetical protein
LAIGRIGEAGLVRDGKQAMRAASDFPVYSVNAPSSMLGIDFSDQQNFWRFGFPAVMVSDAAYSAAATITPHPTATTHSIMCAWLRWFRGCTQF